MKQLRKNKVKAPWGDFNGNDLFEGDCIKHPYSKENGTIVYLTEFNEIDNQWKVDYGDGVLSRLILQIGNKGQAIKISFLKK